MRISNKEQAKKEAILQLPAVTVTAAIIFFIATFICFWNGPIIYQEQVAQLDWPITDATVSYVSEYWSSRGFRHRSRIVYDIYYDYYVDEQIYSGIDEERRAPKELGDTFQIKYNPENPEEHTLTLEPSKSYIESGLIWGSLCLTMVILSIVLIRKGEALRKADKQ